MANEPAYTIQPARYAKGMMAVLITRDGSSFKTRAGCVAEYFARSRFSGREGAYIMSPAAARKFEDHYKLGFDAHYMVRKLIPPSEALKP